MMKTCEYDEEYYDILNTIDRLRDECIKIYGSIFKASKIYGSRNLNKYLNTNAYSLGLKNLQKICKFLNISLQYAVFGGKREDYKDSINTYNNYYRIYKDIYKGRVDHSVYCCYWLAKNGKRSTIPLKYLIKLAKKSKKTVDFLIRG